MAITKQVEQTGETKWNVSWPREATSSTTTVAFQIATDHTGLTIGKAEQPIPWEDLAVAHGKVLGLNEMEFLIFQILRLAQKPIEFMQIQTTTNILSATTNVQITTTLQSLSDKNLIKVTDDRKYYLT